jgi:hypothetical protein
MTTTMFTLQNVADMIVAMAKQMHGIDVVAGPNNHNTIILYAVVCGVSNGRRSLSQTEHGTFRWLGVGNQVVLTAPVSRAIEFIMDAVSDLKRGCDKIAASADGAKAAADGALLDAAAALAIQPTKPAAEPNNAAEHEPRCSKIDDGAHQAEDRALLEKFGSAAGFQRYGCCVNGVEYYMRSLLSHGQIAVMSIDRNGVDAPVLLVEVMPGTNLLCNGAKIKSVEARCCPINCDVAQFGRHINNWLGKVEPVNGERFTITLSGGPKLVWSDAALDTHDLVLARVGADNLDVTCITCVDVRFNAAGWPTAKTYFDFRSHARHGKTPVDLKTVLCCGIVYTSITLNHAHFSVPGMCSVHSVLKIDA